MLADADVDMIVFDVTNQVTYPQSWKASAASLIRSSARATAYRRSPSSVRSVIRKGRTRTLERPLQPNLYPDLWFRWEGKPLILADPNALGGGIERGRRTTPVELSPVHTLRADVQGRPSLSCGWRYGPYLDES